MKLELGKPVRSTHVGDLVWDVVYIQLKESIDSQLWQSVYAVVYDRVLLSIMWKVRARL